MLYTAKAPAITLTMLSKASVRIATDLVVYQAIIFIMNRNIAIAVINFWSFKFCDEACNMAG